MKYTRRQHIVPKFYLNGFAEGNKLQVLDLEANRSYSNSIKDVSVEKDYYTISAEGIEPDGFESWLATVEGKTAGVLRRITDGVWPLNEEERAVLAFFMILQYQRGRGARDLIERFQSASVGLLTQVHGFEKFSQLLDAAFQPSLSEEKKQEFFEWITSYRQGDTTTIKANSHQHIASIVNSPDDLIRFLIGRPWGLVKFKRRSLLTSDEPLGLIANPNMEDFPNVGLLNAELITFPLTRRLGLLMSSPRKPIDLGGTREEIRQGKFDDIIRGTTLHEKLFNSQAVAGAFRNVYFHPQDIRFVPHQIRSQFSK